MISVAAVSNLNERQDWQAATPSLLVDHGVCCARARGWLVATSRSLDFASTDGFLLSGPRWLTHRYEWGPTRWPLSWCEAVRQKAIDCGVFAAFAREIFAAKGLAVYQGQVLRAHAKECTTHWRAKWAQMPGAFNWIDDGIVYHEIIAVDLPRQHQLEGSIPRTLLYDPTDGVWLDPSIVQGHGSHLAARADLPAARRWGERILTPKQWVELSHA